LEKNKVQFQKGLSLTEFFLIMELTNSAEMSCPIFVGQRALGAQNVVMIDIAK
jgi:hypothetical protein